MAKDNLGLGAELVSILSRWTLSESNEKILSVKPPVLYYKIYDFETSV